MSKLGSQLGLPSPTQTPTEPAGSSAQKDQFKAAFQAELAKINECLQYTAAHADQETHTPQAGKRDQSCSAFQMTIPKIDPTNESAAQAAIDQVMNVVKGLSSSISKIKDAVQKAFEAWTERESDFDEAVDKIREMVEWGHEKAGALQTVVEKIAEKANARKYEESLQGLVGMLDKLGPIHEEYLRQLAAQQEYDAALPELQARLGEASVCQYASLAEMQQELITLEDQMKEAAEAKNYVSALEQLRMLETRVDQFLSQLEELEARKQEYENARAELDPQLAEASTCEFQSLQELDQAIVDLTGRTDEAAAAEDYEQAVQLVQELANAVREKLDRTEELRIQRDAYESARTEVDAEVAEVSTSQYESTAEVDQQIVDLTARADEAATADNYEEATRIVQEIATKVSEKKELLEVEAKREEYETARAELDPRLGEASTSQFGSLEELDQEIIDLTARVDEAAAAEDFDTALDTLSTLAEKVDEKLERVAKIEADKAEFENTRKAAVALLEKCFFLANSYKTLKDDQAALKTKLAEADAAAEEEDYEKAAKLATELKSACESYLEKAAEEQKKYDEKAAEVTKQLDEADDVNREEVARDIANDLDPDEIKHMPIEVRNRIMQEIAEGGFSDDDKAAMRELYKVRTLDPEFEEAERVKREELIDRLKNDPEFAKAREDWDDMDKDERLAVMTKAAEIHTEVYGTKDADPPMTVEPDVREPNRDADGNVKSWNNGTYNHNTGKLTVNTHEYEKIKFHDFDKAMDLAVHESGHRYQAVLVDRLDSGDLTEDDPEYNQAVAFKINDPRHGYYARSRESWAAYKNQPLEAHSRESAGEVQGAGIGKHDHDHDHEHEH